jgi:glutamine amidotransferase
MMQPLWQEEVPPSVQMRLTVFCEFVTRMAALGAANFLYSDGDYLFAHAHRRRHDDGEIRAPGLYLLNRVRHEHDVDGDCHADRLVTLLASVPLSDEDWQPIPEHTVLVVRNGHVVERKLLQQLEPV